MYTTKTIEQILDDGFEKYRDYKLCYIDDIETTISDWDEETKALIDSPDFSWEKEHEMFGYNSPRLHLKEYPNPDYIPEKQEKYAYFTPINLNEQWGDDWDDHEYECNAGIPYDTYYDENDKRIEIEIIRIPFYFDYLCSLPHQSYSIEEINNGAASWLYFTRNGKKGKKDTETLYAGDSIEKFVRVHINWFYNK